MTELRGWRSDMSHVNKLIIGCFIIIFILVSDSVWACSKYLEQIQTADLSEAGEHARRELGHEFMRKYDFPSKVLKKLLADKMADEKSHILEMYGDVLLDMAVYRSNYEGVRYLLGNGVSLLSNRQFMENPIFVAASAKDKQMLGLIMEITGGEYNQSLDLANKYIDCVNTL